MNMEKKKPIKKIKKPVKKKKGIKKGYSMSDEKKGCDCSRHWRIHVRGC